MYYFGVFMIIFSICLFLTGLYAYTGHKIGLFSFRVTFRNLTIDGWKNVGKWTMITSIVPFILAILGIIFDFK